MPDSDTDLEAYECTCGVADGDEGHTDDCDLFFCNDWLDGYFTWHHGKLWDTEDLFGWGDEARVEVPLLSYDDQTYACTCYPPEDPSVTEKSKHEKDCDLYNHDKWANAECEWDHQNRSFVYYDKDQTESKTGSGQGTLGGVGWDSYATGAGAFHSCDHGGDTAVEFPDGTKVYPSSSYASTKPLSVPDYALYLEVNRTPRSAAVYIPWPDYGLPKIDYRHAAEVIIDTFALAKAGLTVEVGCIGAHGRTGTAMACMAILAGVPVHEAVDWVKKNHCDSAVENERQRWWVEWFGAYVGGYPAPPMPPEPPPLPASKAGPSTSTTPAHPEDFKVGDPCPKCNTKLIQLYRQGNQVMACNTKDCEYYEGMPICTSCKVSLPAGDLEGYLCWNSQCVQYNAKAPTNKAKRKGRKKGK